MPTDLSDLLDETSTLTLATAGVAEAVTLPLRARSFYVSSASAVVVSFTGEDGGALTVGMRVPADDSRPFTVPGVSGWRRPSTAAVVYIAGTAANQEIAVTPVQAPVLS